MSRTSPSCMTETQSEQPLRFPCKPPRPSCELDGRVRLRPGSQQCLVSVTGLFPPARRPQASLMLSCAAAPSFQGSVTLGCRRDHALSVRPFLLGHRGCSRLLTLVPDAATTTRAEVPLRDPAVRASGSVSRAGTAASRVALFLTLRGTSAPFSTAAAPLCVPPAAPQASSPQRPRQR